MEIIIGYSCKRRLDAYETLRPDLAPIRKVTRSLRANFLIRHQCFYHLVTLELINDDELLTLNTASTSLGDASMTRVPRHPPLILRPLPSVWRMGY